MNTTDARPDDLLLLFSWVAEKLARPSLCNLLESFESWHYRRHLRSRLLSLERRRLLTCRMMDGQPVYELTSLGRLAALGESDPESRWNRSWDRQWRLVFYDFPVPKNSLRKRFRRRLRENRFGHLQGSVWISPDPVDEILEEMGQPDEDVGRVLSAETRSGPRDQAYVSRGWDFELINGFYQQYLDLAVALENPIKENEIKSFPARLRQERMTWDRAVRRDPFLPRPLLPPGYLGEAAWRARQSAMKSVASYFAQSCP